MSQNKYIEGLESLCYNLSKIVTPRSLFFEKYLVSKRLSSSMSETLSFGRKSAVQNDYLKEELVLSGKSFSEVEGLDSQACISLLIDRFGTESRGYFDALQQSPQVNSDGGVETYFNNLLLRNRKIFAGMHPGFYRSSMEFLSGSFLKAVIKRNLLVSFTQTMFFDESGRNKGYLPARTIVRPTGDFKRLMVGSESVLLAEVDTQKGVRAYVPLLSLVNLGIESFSKLQEMKAVEISADLDVASYLYSGGARDRSIVENGGLVVRQDMGDLAGEQMTVGLDSSVRGLDGSVLSVVDEGMAVTFTGATQVFLVSGLPVTYMQIEFEIDGKLKKGFVFCLGLLINKSRSKLFDFENKFSRRVDDYPSSSEVDKLVFKGLPFRLPKHLQDAGLVVGLHRKTDEYFVFSKRHMLKLGGKHMRYLRYNTEYLDKNHEKEFANYISKHEDIVGYCALRFEFESLDDVSHVPYFDDDLVFTLNDLLDEIDLEHNRKMFVSFVNNDGLRFYQSDPARRQDKVDVLKDVKDYKLIKIVRKEGGYLWFECEYIGDDKSLYGQARVIKAVRA